MKKYKEGDKVPPIPLKEHRKQQDKWRNGQGKR